MESQTRTLYQWMKRYESQWSWVTLMTVDTIDNKIHFYLNGKESETKDMQSWYSFSSNI